MPQRSLLIAANTAFKEIEAGNPLEFLLALLVPTEGLT